MSARINVYTCGICKGRTVTVDLDEGVTPFLLGCRATGKEGDCTGTAQSAMYRVPADSPPADWEWYRPDDVELARIKKRSRSLAEHVEHGGLVIRPRRATHTFDACPPCAPPVVSRPCRLVAIDRHTDRCHADVAPGELCGLLRAAHPTT